MPSRLRDRLRRGQPLVGTVLTSRDPLFAEVVGHRWDLAWIDLEHSALDVADVPILAAVLQAAGCAALVRTPAAEYDRLAAVLDAGIDGIVLPRVETAVAVAQVVARVRRPPHGLRGYAARRDAMFGLRDDRGDEPPVVMAQIESGAAVAAARAIGEVEGVDALVVGTADLALDLGVSPDVADPSLATAVRGVGAAAREAGVLFGVAAGGDPEAIRRAADPDLVVYAADARIYAQALDAAAARVRAALSVTPRPA